MGDSLLTVDLGNSATKLRAWRVDSDGVLRRHARLDFAAQLADDGLAAQFFERNSGFEFAAMSSVAGENITARWRGIIAAGTQVRLLEDLDSGLANLTQEPERVGRDRLFAARGALECIGESAIVINVGTALTVDALLAEAAPHSAKAWRRGSFLGGAIAPGPLLLARALAQGTARLFEVVPAADPPALGRNSTQAMLSGIGLGIRGAARELALEVARAAGLADPPLALSGGARAFVASAFTSRRVFESEDLVHLGLCAALLEGAGRPRPAGFAGR